MGSVETAVSKINNANSLFLNNNKNKNCPLKNPITRLQAILKNLKFDSAKDSSSLSQALLYAKSKFSGYVQVRFTFDSVSNPLVSVQSFDPFIFPFPSDSTNAEIYLFSGKHYRITVSHANYYSCKTVVVTKDTTLLINLKAIPIPTIHKKCALVYGGFRSS